MVSRYIHLNPVRAGIVDRPEDYRFSSYPGYHYKRKRVPWITYDAVLREFSSEMNQSRRLYRQFVTAGIAESGKAPWADAWHSLVLGSDSFLRRVKHLVEDREADASVPQLGKLRDRPSLERIAAVVAAEFGCQEGAWSENRRSDDASPAMAAYLARRVYGYPSSAVAASLGYRSHGRIAHAVARLEGGSNTLHEMARRLQNKLAKP